MEPFKNSHLLAMAMHHPHDSGIVQTSDFNIKLFHQTPGPKQGLQDVFTHLKGSTWLTSVLMSRSPQTIEQLID